MRRLPRGLGKDDDDTKLWSTKRRAYNDAKPADDTYIELPDSYDAGTRVWKSGKLKRCLYGTRQAARAWQRELEADIKEADLKIGEMSKCTFRSGCCKLVVIYDSDALADFS